MEVVWSNWMQLRPAMLASGAVSEQKFEEAAALLNDPATVITSPVMWSVWGRRPAAL